MVVVLRAGAARSGRDEDGARQQNDTMWLHDYLRGNGSGSNRSPMVGRRRRGTQEWRAGGDRAMAALAGNAVPRRPVPCGNVADSEPFSGAHPPAITSRNASP
jgi:hypothetical protein